MPHDNKSNNFKFIFQTANDIISDEATADFINILQILVKNWLRKLQQGKVSIQFIRFQGPLCLKLL